MTELKTTALHDTHAKLGAHFTDFGGWEMPLRYGSELSEHRAVRSHAGLFDLSHMGEIWVDGPEAATFLNTALVGDLAVVANGRAKYSLMCTPEGGIIDDLICYRISETRYLVVPNAGNSAAVAAELLSRSADFEVTISDVSAELSLIAVQGPAAAEIMQKLVAAEARAEIAELRYYAHLPATVAGHNVLLARTGYTGEDGFELYIAHDEAAALWAEITAAGEPLGLIAAGLACRDSLRLEAGMPLYGNELSLSTNPFVAGLGAVVSFKKPENFVGRAALEALREAESKRVLVGLRGTGRRAGRGGYAALSNGAEVGAVTSGQLSPTLGEPIALAMIDPSCALPGTAIDIDVRGTAVPYTVVELPFYRRPTSKPAA